MAFDDPRQGTALAGRYVLEARIGSGGAGIVWRAHDRVLDRRVAVKLLHANLAGDATSAARFRSEAASAARLTHPNAVVVFDIGRDGERDYLVMELVDGPDLAEVIAGARLPAGVAAHVGRAVAAALGAAHARDLVHRDVKPGNVLLSRDGVPKVADFGIARAVGAAMTRLTQPGSVMGTARYVAPEQLRDDPVDARADVYALGLVLYEVLTGSSPWGEGTATEVAMRRLSGDHPAPSTGRDDLPPGLDAVIARATRVEPEERYGDGTEMASALAPFVDAAAAGWLAKRVRELAASGPAAVPGHAAPGAAAPGHAAPGHAAPSSPQPRDRDAAETRSPSGTRAASPTTPPTAAPTTPPAAAPTPASAGPTTPRPASPTAPPPGSTPPRDTDDPNDRHGRDGTRVLDSTGAERNPTAPGTPPGSSPTDTSPTDTSAAATSGTDPDLDEPRSAPPARRRRRTWILAGLAVSIAAVVGILGLLDGSSPRGDPTGGDGQDASDLPVVAVGDHDPLGDEEERADLLEQAIDGDSDTSWHSETYFQADLIPPEKDGVGIWFDLGETAEIRRLDLELVAAGGSFEVWSGDDVPGSEQGPDDWGTRQAEVTDAGTDERIELDGASGRVWLVWFTELPPTDDGRFRAHVADVRFRSS